MDLVMQADDQRYVTLRLISRKCDKLDKLNKLLQLMSLNLHSTFTHYLFPVRNRHKVLLKMRFLLTCLFDLAIVPTYYLNYFPHIHSRIVLISCPTRKNKGGTAFLYGQF